MPFDATPSVKSDTEAAAMLGRAKALIEDPNDWCQYRQLRISDGRKQHCAWGAYLAVVAAHQMQSTFADAALCVESLLGQDNHAVLTGALALKSAARSGWAINVVGVNDSHGHAAVMQMFDRAIALANGRE